MDIPGLLVPGTLYITKLECEGDTIIFYADTWPVSSRCPLCNHLSNQVYSRYTRTLADLPCAGKQVYLRVTLRKFHCPNEGCSRKVFAERLDDVARAYARRTTRQQQTLEAIAFALGGASS
jgi:transposase